MLTALVKLFAFLSGLGSSLFVDTPFGRAAMFDLACYVLGPILFALNLKKFKIAERRILMLALLWLLGAVYTNWWREEPFSVALKGNAIVFNVWCMIVVGIWLLEKDYRTWLWFMVGNGISNVLSLYYFQNGALLFFAEQGGYLGAGGMQNYLIEKQIYPLYLRSTIKSVLLPLVVLVRFPWLPVIVIIISASFFLLFNGGSRTGFGVNLISGLFFIGYAYFRRTTKFVLDNFVLMSGLAVISAMVIFASYRHFAVSGSLGDAEYEKYEREMVDSDAGILGSRDDIIRAWPFLRNHPLVGSGSSAIDRWGYMVDDYLLPGHSALVGAWVQNGILGLVFWVYALSQVLLFAQRRALHMGSYAPFLVMIASLMIWNILFSPFGLHRGELSVLLALCVVSKDVQWLKNVELLVTKRKSITKNVK